MNNDSLQIMIYASLLITLYLFFYKLFWLIYMLNNNNNSY